MKTIFSFSILSLLFFISVSSLNAATLESSNKLYIKSGLEKQMMDIGPALLAGYRNNYSKTKIHSARDRTINRNIAQIITNSFSVQSMRKMIVTGLMENISDLEMQHILEWLNSSAGQKITMAEEMASSEKGVRETQAYIKTFNSSKASRERVRLIKDLNTFMNITETSVQIALSTQFALSMTVNKPKKKLNHADIQSLYKTFQKNRPRLEPMIKHQVHGSLLYTYQNLADYPLEKYLTFIKSESGKKYSSATSTIVVQIITDCSLQFAFEISQF